MIAPMSQYLFSPAHAPYAEIAGPERLRFPVHRIYCVGRNYAEHAREMGMDPVKEPPFFFTKPADAIVHDGADVPYPPRTANLHHEIELVVAIGKGGRNIAVEQALEHVYGYAVGNDYTRRDLQKAARDAGRPWDTAKGFDQSAAISAIHPVAAIGHPARARIWLTVNGEKRQEADVADMIWDVPSVIAELSTLWYLQPGDLIYTGTPAGVGPVLPGDSVVGGVDGVDTLRNTIFAAR
jgi:fumarylpyruvate hydrolase